MTEKNTTEPDLEAMSLEELRALGEERGVENAPKLNTKTLQKRLGELEWPPHPETPEDTASAPEGGTANPEPPAESRPKHEEGERIVVHFLADGLTALGRLWYRGEELSVDVGSEEWERTLDAEGNSFLDLDRVAQVRRWEKEMFAPGRWPYDGWDRAFDPDENGAAHAEPDAEALKAAEKARQRNAPPPGYRERNRTSAMPGISPKARAS